MSNNREIKLYNNQGINIRKFKITYEGQNTFTKKIYLNLGP
jgi:hypothetical protein